MARYVSAMIGNIGLIIIIQKRNNPNDQTSFDFFHVSGPATTTLGMFLQPENHM